MSTEDTTPAVIRSTIAALVVLAIMYACGCTSTGTRTHTKDAEALDVHEVVTAHGADAIAALPTLKTDTTTRTRHTTSGNITPPPTAGQRIAAIAGTFGGVALVAVICLAVFCPGIVAAWALRTARAYKAAFSETVAAIHHSDAVNKQPELHDALTNSQTPATRALVEKVRAEA